MSIYTCLTGTVPEYLDGKNGGKLNSIIIGKVDRRVIGLVNRIKFPLLIGLRSHGHYRF